MAMHGRSVSFRHRRRVIHHAVLRADRQGRDTMAFDSSLLRRLSAIALDFFRGIGLWMCFLDHVPHDVVAWLTLRNYGFSDAAEFFVFISGYLIGWIHARSCAADCSSPPPSGCGCTGQLYIAHIMLFHDLYRADRPRHDSVTRCEAVQRFQFPATPLTS